MSNTQPYPSGSSEGYRTSRRTPGLPPPAVRNAVRLMLIGAGISIISLILGVATMGSLKSQIRDQLESGSQHVSESMLNASYTIAIVSAIVSGVLGTLLWLWMAWKNGQGRRWARILATVFAAINLISTIYGIAGYNATTASWVVQLVGLAVGIVVVVLLWRKESSQFFNAGRRQVA